MEKELWCPLAIDDIACNEKCAWWHKIWQTCVVHKIAGQLQGIESEVSNLDEHIIDVRHELNNIVALMEEK